MKAGQALLERGAVRVKPGAGIAGLGQSVVDTVADLAAAIDAIEPEAMSASGVVVEQNLVDVTTYSVGQVRVADCIGTYYGTQTMTTNHHGAEVYGGSDLTVVRGGFDALLACRCPTMSGSRSSRPATYDAAARECFAGLFASRRNYDVAQGRDGTGTRSFGRARAIVAAWRGERRGDRRAGGVSRGSVARGRACEDA